jgi:Fe-S oxidoreductase
VAYAILGQEERCSGDPARRAGNEFLFQMTAAMNIETLNMYGVQQIVTACPHCFNTLKNEYPQLGGNYDVVHHTQLINELITSGRLKLKEGGEFKGKRITYHDSCYMGRVNGVYEAPRALLEALDVDLVEMKRSRTNGLCCGAGGAQMWKEDEPGDKRINLERADEALLTHADAVAANCPFCITMLQDGLKAREKNDQVPVYDLSEMILSRLG